MTVSYSSPISLAWARMQRLLFRPFRFEAWLTLAFALFLANIGTFLGNAGNTVSSRSHGTPGSLQIPDDARDRILGWLTNPTILMGIGVALVAFLVIALVLSYVSARAEFVWFDDIAQERAAFTKPWSRFGPMGRSLFLLRAALSFLYLVPLAMIGPPLWSIGSQLLHGATFNFTMLTGLALMGPLAGLACLAIGFVHLLTQDFVIPLMYARSVDATRAWQTFLPLLRSRLGDFVAYSLLMLVLEFGVALAVMAAGVLTCCIGLILVSLPYVNSIVLLPLFAARRAIGPEFLAQYGPEWVTMAAAQAPQDLLITPPAPPTV